ncbi:MAG: DNA mismatch repair protein MutS [Flavicella sp.]
MKPRELQKGDKVLVMNESVRGVVVGVNGNDILVLEENGFELPHKPENLIKLKQEQSDLSRCSDVDNTLFLQKKFEKVPTKKTKKTKNKKENLHPPMEVDLHIQHLVKSTRGMSNFDMLTRQLDTAKYKLEFAIRKRIPRVVFIHGVGEGVLQKELNYLFAKYPVKITDGSYKKYGQGATEVYIIQNNSRN